MSSLGQYLADRQEQDPPGPQRQERPSFEEFAAAIRQEHPGVSDWDLATIYDQEFGPKGDGESVLGATVRGFTDKLPQLQQSAGYAVGLAGESLRRNDVGFGEGLRDWGLGVADRAGDKIESRSQGYESLSGMQEDGTLGGWLRGIGYNVGQGAASLVESGIPAAAGAAIGSAAAPGPGTLTGGAAGLVGKKAGLGEINRRGRTLAEETTRKNYQTAGALIGAAPPAIAHGFGQNVQAMIQELGSIEDIDIGTATTAAAGSAAINYIGAMPLLYGLGLAGKGALLPASRAGRAGAIGGVTAAGEGIVGMGDVAITRWATGKPITEAGSLQDYLDGAFGGAIQGGTAGTLAGAMGPGPEQAPELDPEEQGRREQLALPNPANEPFVVFPDGTTAKPWQVQEAIARLEAEGRTEEAIQMRSRLMGFLEERAQREQEAGQLEQLPPDPMIVFPDGTQATLSNLEQQINELVDAGRESEARDLAMNIRQAMQSEGGIVFPEPQALPPPQRGNEFVVTPEGETVALTEGEAWQQNQEREARREYEVSMGLHELSRSGPLGRATAVGLGTVLSEQGVAGLEQMAAEQAGEQGPGQQINNNPSTPAVASEVAGQNQVPQPVVTRGPAGTTPEPDKQIRNQIDALSRGVRNDPIFFDGQRTDIPNATWFAAERNGMPVFPAANGGMWVAKNWQQKQAILQLEQSGLPQDEVMRQALGYTKGKDHLDPSTTAVVQTRDAKGNIIRSEAADAGSVAGAIATATPIAERAQGTVEIASPESEVNARMEAGTQDVPTEGVQTEDGLAMQAAKQTESIAIPRRPQPMGDARLEQPGYRQGVERLADDAGWAQEGGRHFIDNEGQANRMKWQPRAPWWTHKPAGVTAATVRSGVEKALAGEKLNANERRSVDFLLNLVEAQETLADLAALREFDTFLDQVYTQLTDAQLAEMAAPDPQLFNERSDYEQFLRESEGRDQGPAGQAVTRGPPEGTRPDADQGRTGDGSPQTRNPDRNTEGRGRDSSPDQGPAEPFGLEAQTPAQLRAQEEARAEAERQAQAKQKAEQDKAEADAQVDTFTLAGSNRDADANPGQGDLLSQATTQAPKAPEPSRPAQGQRSEPATRRPDPPADLIGENSPQSLASLRRLAADPDTVALNGTLIDGKDKQGNQKPAWRPVPGKPGFSARQYLYNGKATQEVRHDASTAVARRALYEDGQSAYAELEGAGTLDSILSGQAFDAFNGFFAKPEALATPKAERLNDELLRGDISVAEYLERRNLDPGDWSRPQDVREQASARTEYGRLIQEIRQTLEGRKDTPNKRMQQDILGTIEREFEHPFRNRYATQLAPGLRKQYGRRADAVPVGNEAKRAHREAEDRIVAEAVIRYADEAPAIPKPADTSRLRAGPAQTGPKSKLGQAIQAALGKVKELSDVRVVDTAQALPPAVLARAKALGHPPGQIYGVYHNGSLYVVAENVGNLRGGIRAAVHEAIGHKGVIGVLGSRLDAVLAEVFESFPKTREGARVMAQLQADRPDLDPSNPKHRPEIAEELIAYVIESGERAGMIGRVIAAIRAALRELFPQVKWSNADIIALGEQSRAYMRRQQEARSQGDTRFKVEPETRLPKRPQGSDEVSVRMPTALAASNRAFDHIGSFARLNVDSLVKAGLAEKQAGIIAEQYKNYRPTASAVTPEQVLRRMKAHVESNVLWLYDQIPQDVRDSTRRWYDGANRIANTWADRYGVQPRQVAAVMAALSPQKDWFQNASLAERVLDIWTEQQNTPWSERMDSTMDRIFDKPRHRIFDSIRGKTLSEIDHVGHKAAWLRAFDETFNDRAYRAINPDGSLGDPMLTASGATRDVAWGSTSEIAKTVSALMDPSDAGINRALGTQHKVRNFFNNIIAPGSARGSITVDTHAVAAGLLQALSGESMEVKHNFGSNVLGEPGPGGSVKFGVHGTYAIYAEAYTSAAKKRGILPREMQSITWEVVRQLFSDSLKKNTATLAKIEGEWSRYREGGQSLEATRANVWDIAGGVDFGVWRRPNRRSDDPAGRATYDRGVPGDQLPGAGLQEGTAAGRGRGDATGAVPGAVDQIRFSAAPRTGNNLYVSHNLSANNLRHALELGGLAAPSLAVARTDRGFGNFGEITLLADPSFLRSAKVRTFDADVYSPRHPRPEYVIPHERWNAFVQSLGEQHGLTQPDLDAATRSASDMAYNAAVKLGFLRSIGKDPKPKQKKVAPELRKAAALEAMGPNELRADPKLIALAEKYYARAQKEAIEAVVADGTPRAVIEAQYGRFYTDENGALKQGFINKFASQAWAQKERGGVDVSALETAIQRILRPKAMKKQYEAWVIEQHAKLHDGARLPQGFTASGNRRYSAYTLDAVVREMTRKLQDGEGFNYGVGNVRASVAKEFKSIAQIQADRDRIVSPEQAETMKAEASERFMATLEALKPHYRFDGNSWRYMDDASKAIAEGPRAWQEAFKVDADVRKIITDLRDYLSRLPTEYFEAKAQRAVALNEFVAAVVPKGTAPDVVTALKDAGLAIRTYKEGDAESRRKATDKAAEEGKIRFSFAGPQSETADIHALANAKDRVERGTSPELVRQETGWFRGADQKWRYEISDADARLIDADPTQMQDSTTINLGDLLEHDRLFAAYPDLQLIPITMDHGLDSWGQVNGYGTRMTLNPTKFPSPEAMLSIVIHEAQHLIQRREGFARGGNLEMTGAVTDALKKFAEQKRDDVAQFESNYGDLFQSAHKARRMVGFAHMYQDANRLIDYANADRPSSVFRHIRGATEWLYTPLIQDDPVLRTRAYELNRSLYELPKRGPKRNAFLRQFAFDLAQLLREAVPARDWQMLKNDPRKTASMLRAFERESEKASARLKPHWELKEGARMATAQFDNARFKSSFEVYQLLAGEVEARNTENRAKMTDEERRSTPPRATMTADRGFGGKETINPDEVIVVMQGGEIETPFIANVGPPGDVRFSFAGPQSETADATPQAQTPEFKKWFGDSIATVDGKPGSEPLIVYHGTPTGGFSVFDAERQGSKGGHSRGGFSFTTNPEAAEAYSEGFSDETNSIDFVVGKANEAFRKIWEDFSGAELQAIAEEFHHDAETPVEWSWQVIDTLDDAIDGLHEGAQVMASLGHERHAELFRAAIKEAAAFETNPEVFQVYLQIPPDAPVFEATPDTLGQVVADLDVRKVPGRAAVVNMPNGERVFYVADSTQIKSAFENSGAFDGSNPDIRFSRKSQATPNADAAPQTETRAFAEWFGDSKVADESGEPLIVHHSTTREFDTFSPLSHFGTEKAAQERLATVAEYLGDEAGASRTIAAYLAIEKPLEVSDNGLVSPLSIAEAATQAVGIEFDQDAIGAAVEKWLKSLSGDELQQVSWAAGYRSEAPTLAELKADILQEFGQAARYAEAILAGGDIRHGVIGDTSALAEVVTKTLEEAGYDGLVYQNDVEDAGTQSWIAFRPEQVKSAAGNTGAFDSANPDIRFSRKSQATPLGMGGPKVEHWITNMAKLRGFFESAADTLRRTPGLEKLGEALRVYYDNTQANRAKVNKPEQAAKAALGKLKRKERAAVLEQFKKHRAAMENGRTQEAQRILANASPTLRTVIESWQQIADITGDMARKAGVMVKDAKTGKWRAMGNVKNFWPRQFSEAVERALDAPHRHPEMWNKLVAAIYAQGKHATLDEAAQRLIEYRNEMGGNVSDVDYFAGIEKGRSEPLPEIFYDYSFDAGLLYKEKWADRMAQIQAFGQTWGEGFQKQNDLFDSSLETTRDDYTRNYILRVRSRAYNERYNDPIIQFTQSLNTLATGIQLGNPATALLNLIGGTALTFQAYGIRASLKGLMQTVGTMQRFKDQHGLAYDLGVLRDDYLQIMHDSERSGTPAWLRLFTGGMLKYGGYTPAEHFVRTHNMVVGKGFLNSALRAFNQSPGSKEAAKYAKWIQRQGFDVDTLVQENGTGAYTDRFIRGTVNLTQGSYKIDQTPVYVDTVIGRFLFKYQKFGTQLSRMFWMHHLRPFVDSIQGGEKVTYKIGDEQYSARLYNFLPLLRFFGVAAAAGMVLMDWREELFGYQNKAPTLRMIEKALEDDDTAKAMAQMSARAFHGGMSVGMFGFFGNYFQLAYDVADRQRVKSPLSPPALGPLTAMGELAMRAVDQGELTWRDMDSFAQQSLSIYRTGKRAASNTGLGEVVPWRELQVQSAKSDVAFVKKMTRQFAADTGLEAKRRSTGGFAATANTVFNTRLVDALLVGDAARARIMVREHFADRGRFPDEASRRNAMLSLKGSVRAREPSRVGIAPSDATRLEFLRWARANTTAEEFARIQAISNNYRKTARAAGLL